MKRVKYKQTLQPSHITREVIFERPSSLYSDGIYINISIVSNNNFRYYNMNKKNPNWQNYPHIIFQALIYSFI